MTQPYRGRTTVVIDHPSQDISWRSPTNLAEVTARLFAGINAGATGTYADTEVTVEQGGAQAYGTVTLSGVGGTAASGALTMSGVGGTAATGTITFSSSSGGWTVTINGIELSGTSAGDDDTEGDELVGLIQGNGTLDALLTASNSIGVVTLTAKAKGTAGNAVTLAVTGTGLSRSAATLEGGAQGSVAVTINGTLVTTNTTNLSDAAAATAVATAIEANGTLAPLVTVPAPVDENVDITWNVKGVVGNAVTFTSTTATGTTSPTGSGFLTLGADGSVDVVVAGTTVTTDTTDMTDSEAATAVAAAVTADATVDNVASASAAAEVVTVTALVYGTAGNIITLTAATDTGTATTGHLSGGKLSGGTAVTSNVLRRP